MSEEISGLHETFVQKHSVKSSEAETTASFLRENPHPEARLSKDVEIPISKESNADNKHFMFDGLSNMNIYGYAIGHFLNDLTSAGWFNYLTIYLKSINPIDPKRAGFYAGLVFLSGQISDGVSTPLFGYLSDKTNTRLGKRIPWFIFGLFLVCISYIFIFQTCLFCQWFGSDGEGMKVFYYVLFPSLFNIGWASMQIAHMSLVPSLSSSRMRRDKMNGMRNTFKYVANFTVLLIALILFIAIDTPVTQFQCLSYISVGLGLAASVFFLSQIDEVKLTKACITHTRKIKEYLKNMHNPHYKSPEHDEKPFHEEKFEGHSHDLLDLDLKSSDEPNENENHDEFHDHHSTHSSHLSERIVHWIHWFNQVMFYQYGLVYMSIRLVGNATSSLFNFYLVYVITITDADLSKSTPKELAIVSLILYSFSVIGSILLDPLYNRIGRKKTYSLGALCILATSFAMIFIDKSINWMIYPVAIVNGFGQSLTMNTAIALISEVIGLKGSSGAFVFGVYGFCDKVVNGIVLFLVFNSTYFENNDPTFIRWTIVVIPAFACIFAWVFIIAGKAKDYKVGDDQGLEDEFAQ